jgi:hypothetical protein
MTTKGRGQTAKKKQIAFGNDNEMGEADSLRE